MEQQNGQALLEVSNLQTWLYLDKGVSKVLNGVSFSIASGETLGVVGESGCGKSMTALSIMRLIPSPPGRIVGGSIKFNGEDLLDMPKSRMRKIRGGKIGMIFQEPMTSLNPLMTVGKQIEESVRIHESLHGKAAKDRAMEMLEMVNMPLPAQRYNEYPHQLSGGMRQRVMIAIALAGNPQLLICDEPTTALDVTIQAQILRLINTLKKQIHMSVMLITHDLGVVSQVADRVIVMYAGRIVEYGSAKTIFTCPQHPYTEALLKSIPDIHNDARSLYMIKGMVPDLLDPPAGCMFAPRCEYATEECRTHIPGYVKTDYAEVACFRCRGAKK